MLRGRKGYLRMSEKPGSLERLELERGEQEINKAEVAGGRAPSGRSLCVPQPCPGVK